MRAVKPTDMNHAGVRVATVCVRRKIGEIGHYIDLLLTSTTHNRVQVPGSEAILTKNGCPEDLRKFWLGHENPDISDDYPEQLLEDIERRQEVAARIGLGFKIPEPSFVPNVPKTSELHAVAVAA
jgi:hypothetical protein